MEIIANGKKGRVDMEVVYADGKFLFNGNESFSYDLEMRYLLSERYPIGGTFYPDEKDVRNIINVLRYFFFDHVISNDDIKVYGEVEPIPQEAGEGGVY